MKFPSFHAAAVSIAGAFAFGALVSSAQAAPQNSADPQAPEVLLGDNGRRIEICLPAALSGLEIGPEGGMIWTLSPDKSSITLEPFHLDQRGKDDKVVVFFKDQAASAPSLILFREEGRELGGNITATPLGVYAFIAARLTMARCAFTRAAPAP